jgi:hypothetical protein
MSEIPKPDIVDSLRRADELCMAYADGRPDIRIYRDAADEIERLRRELARFKLRYEGASISTSPSTKGYVSPTSGKYGYPKD